MALCMCCHPTCASGESASATGLMKSSLQCISDAICPFELLTSVERTAYRFAGNDRAYVVPSPTHLVS
jgi:hypothetical protein